MRKRRLSLLDRLISEADTVLRTVTSSGHSAGRPSPAEGHADSQLSNEERRHVAGLMRVNHTGEVCAQALYQGQALTAKLPTDGLIIGIVDSINVAQDTIYHKDG